MKKYFYFVAFHTRKEREWNATPQTSEVEMPQMVSSMNEIVIMECKLMALGHYCPKVVNFQLLRVEG